MIQPVRGGSIVKIWGWRVNRTSARMWPSDSLLPASERWGIGEGVDLGALNANETRHSTMVGNSTERRVGR